MYSGTTFTRASGKILGAHQKIDRIALRQLRELLPPGVNFPNTRDILHFEGYNGPDAVKRKCPAQNEPWHYLRPYDFNDNELIEIIESHYSHLIQSLKNHDKVRSSFEAAWLAHAIVDGLTPAHHYPYGEKVIELRGGQSLDSRTTILKKLLMPGTSIWGMVKNNWKFWGPKGLLMTHISFEMGIATMLRLTRLPRLINFDARTKVDIDNIGDWYRKTAQQIADLDLYNRFYVKGWTRSIAKEVNKELIPTIVETVVLTWYGAVMEANSTS